MSRVPLVAADAPDPTVAAAFERFAAEGREPIALYRALANAPDVLQAYGVLAREVRSAGPTELRELLTLRVADLTGSDYEWSHHRKLALAAGLTEGTIAAVPAWRGSHRFGPRERTALACIDELHEIGVTGETFSELLRHFSLREAIWIVTLGSFYELVARIVQALDVEVEPAYRADRRPGS